MQQLAFDHEPARMDAVDVAITLAENPPDPDTRTAITAAINEDVTFWGPRGVPPGAELALEQDSRGLFASVDGQRIPATIDGPTLRLGTAGRLGDCAAWAVVAAGRLLDEGASSACLVFGRCMGAQQTWAECQDADGRWLVYDLTLSERPFSRGGYYGSLRAVPGTRLPIPDAATLTALHEAIEAGAWDGYRPETLSSEALARRQQKE